MKFFELVFLHHFLNILLLVNQLLEVVVARRDYDLIYFGKFSQRITQNSEVEKAKQRAICVIIPYQVNLIMFTTQ